MTSLRYRLSNFMFRFRRGHPAKGQRGISGYELFLMSRYRGADDKLLYGPSIPDSQPQFKLPPDAVVHTMTYTPDAPFNVIRSVSIMQDVPWHKGRQNKCKICSPKT